MLAPSVALLPRLGRRQSKRRRRKLPHSMPLGQEPHSKPGSQQVPPLGQEPESASQLGPQMGSLPVQMVVRRMTLQMVLTARMLMMARRVSQSRMAQRVLLVSLQVVLLRVVPLRVVPRRVVLRQVVPRQVVLRQVVPMQVPIQVPLQVVLRQVVPLAPSPNAPRSVESYHLRRSKALECAVLPWFPSLVRPRPHAAESAR